MHHAGPTARVWLHKCWILPAESEPKFLPKPGEKSGFLPSFIFFHHSKCGICCQDTMIQNERSRMVCTNIHLSCVSILRHSTQRYMKDQYKHVYIHVKTWKLCFPCRPLITSTFTFTWFHVLWSYGLNFKWHLQKASSKKCRVLDLTKFSSPFQGSVLEVVLGFFFLLWQGCK